MKRNYSNPESDKQFEALCQDLCLKLPFAVENDSFILTDEDSGEVISSKGSFTLSFDAPRTSKLIHIRKA